MTLCDTLREIRQPVVSTRKEQRRCPLAPYSPPPDNVWAMSQENVELVRGMWEPFKGVDTTAIDWGDEAIREITERFWSPEIELRWSRRGPEAVYQGREAVIHAFRDWLEPFSEYYHEPLDFIEVGDRVVEPNRQWGIGSTSGIRVEAEFVWVYEVRDSQIARIDEYDSQEEALEAVGP